MGLAYHIPQSPNLSFWREAQFTFTETYRACDLGLVCFGNIFFFHEY
jgi:hypothetical protein